MQVYKRLNIILKFFKNLIKEFTNNWKVYRDRLKDLGRRGETKIANLQNAKEQIKKDLIKYSYD